MSPHALSDPVLTEIIRNGLVAITEEMKTNLMRTAYNMIIYEALDFTVGLLDAEGNTVSIGLGLPMFIRGMSDTVKAKLRHFGGPAGLQPGDVLLTNDAYLTGSHLNHMTFSVPIFCDGELVAFASCMAHWQDVGGALGGMTADIYAEGLQMPIVKFARAGVVNEELLAIVQMNVRVPERALGDLRAQIAALKTGEKRMQEMVAKYGRDAVLASIHTIMDQSEAAARESIRAIPDGVYEAESFLDDDGVDVGTKIPIRVKVTVANDRMTVDLSGVSDQVRGFYNSGETAGRSCAQVAFKCLTSPLELPINDGCFRALDIILPPGKVVSAVKPAPMRWWMTYPMTIVDTIFKALAPAIPDQVIAGHHADLVIAKISGRHPRDGKLFLYTGGLIGGGWGAKLTEDGMNATIAINDGDTHNGPSEQVEVKFPLVVEAYRLREDSGGAGRYRGGLGTEQVVQTLADIAYDSQIERVDSRPWGLEGGLSAAGNQVALQRANETSETAFPSGKVLSRLLKAGDRYFLRSGGGGGFGSPLDRDASAVADDVRHGYVSGSAAQIQYGVVLDGDTGRANLGATHALRERMRRAGLPKDHRFSSCPVFAAEAGRTVDPEAMALQKAIHTAGMFTMRCC
ncbi:MAG: hydantoinase B/oxoprolinase family protein [Burkholderiales bacterium]